jgi:aminopeptidase N
MPVAEITRAETAERAALLQVDSYDVALDLTRGTEEFGSTSVIRFSCSRPGAASYADLIAETVHEITLNGSPISPAEAYADGRITLTELAARNELRVVADCAYTKEDTGLHRTVDSADGRTYTYTSFEPADARRVFANFEQPDLKAEFTFHVTVPEGWTVLSNSPAPDPAPAGQDASVWHFSPTPRISTYLTAIVAGEYHLVAGSHTAADGREIPLHLACRRSLAEFLDPDDIFLLTRQGLDYYEQLFATPYPFAKYDQAFVPEYGGAMENVGCVTFAEEFIFRSRVTDSAYELRAAVILHEMAHMWFGDLVTMKWWDDLWLNESFAEFCEVIASTEATRFTGAWTTFANGRKAWGYLQDRLPSTHPIAADAPTLSQAISNFDGISYAKGASVLRQLVAYVGREQFFTGIRAYLAEHGWRNATLADLLGKLEKASGKPLAEWSKAWLETAGPNVLRAELKTAPDGTIGEFAVLQEASAEHPALRPHRIGIGFYDLADGRLTRTHRVDADIAGPRTPVPALAGRRQPDLILLNDGDLGYAIVRFDPRSLATLVSSVGGLDDPLARAVCWAAVIDMVTQAELALPAFVRMVAGAMESEPSLAVLQNLHQFTRQTITQFADPAWVPEGKRELAAVAERLLRTAEPGSDWQLAWAQLLGWTAVADEQLGLLERLLDGSEQLPGLAVDAELRWALLMRLCVTGRGGHERIDAELARDATDAGRRHADACRAALPTAEDKAAAWRLLTETEELGVQSLVEAGLAFSQPEHAHLLAPYASRYLEVLPRIWSTRSEHFREYLARLLFPHPAASAEVLRQFDAFLAEEHDPGLARAVLEKRDIVARALRSRLLPDPAG